MLYLLFPKKIGVENTGREDTEPVRAKEVSRPTLKRKETQRSWPSRSSSLRRKSISAWVSAGLATIIRKKLPRVPWGW